MFLIGIIFLLFTTYNGLVNVGVWADEIYSLVLSTMDFNGAMDIILNDVHPVLYYLILRFFIDIFSFAGFDNFTVVGKFVSLLPIYLIAVLTLTKIKKNFGMLTAGLFFLCICSMPRLMIYSIEVRMYSWALFFVTASLIYAYETAKNPYLKNWIILTVLTILFAYTHYFSAIASFSIYVVFLAYIIRKNRKLFKGWLVSAVISVAAYVPWIFVALNQISRITGVYWIESITKKGVLSYIYFVLSPATELIRANELTTPTIIGTLCLFAFIFLLYKYRDEFTSDSIMVFLIVPVIGIIASLTVQPVFHPRYLVPVLGCLWLAFSILLSKSFSNKKIFIPILMLILIIGVVGAFDFNNLHNEDVKITETEFNYLNGNIGSDNVVLFNSNYMFHLFYNVPDNHFIIWDSNSETFKSKVENPYVVDEINNGSDVYYVDSSYDNVEKIIAEGYDLREIPVSENCSIILFMKLNN